MSDAIQQAGEDAAAAAEAEAEERDWGTSQEDIEAYAQIAGAVAGAAACSAVGAAAAAPLCAWVAGAITEWFAGTVYGWFDNSAEVEAALERRREVRAHFASMKAASELGTLNGTAFQQMLDQLVAMHEELWPGERWEGLDPNHPQARWQRAMLMLQINGAPLQSYFGEHTLLGLASIPDYWWELQNQGMSDANKNTYVTNRAIEVFEQLERAYTASVIQLTAMKGAEWGFEEAAAQSGAASRAGQRIAEQFGLGEFAGRASTEERIAQQFGLGQYAVTPPPLPSGRRGPMSMAAEENEQLSHAQTRGAHPRVPVSERAWSAAGWRTGAALGAVAGVGFLVRKVFS